MKTLSRKIQITLCVLLPLLGTALYLLALGLVDGRVDVRLGNFPILRPLELPSLVGVLVFMAVIVVWAAVGMIFAGNRVAIGKSLLLAHAIPAATTVIYSVCHLLTALILEGDGLTDFGNLIGSLGMGLFNLVGSYLFLLIPLKIFEIYVDLAIMVGVFVIGYSIKAGKASKK
ncbi:MAG: hypothetical protein KBS76_04965 [Ruminococcus sp.]|nr:hypothetical protein [Candidatus Apopatosoma intestinale]